jgi:hypothetical protein
MNGSSSKSSSKSRVRTLFNVESESEEEAEMNNWIENVQKYNGLAQTAIDSLCSMEFEGG